MVMMVVSVLLSTANCSTWRGDSAGDRSYEVVNNNSKTYLAGFLHNPLTVCATESSDSG